LAVFALGYLSSVAIVHSPLGLLMRGVRENEFRVELLGLNPYLIKLVAFCWAAIVAGLAGAAYAAALGHVHAGLFDPSVSGQAMAWAFFGGIGSLTGSLIGAAVLAPLEDYMSSFLGYPKLFTGILLVTIVISMHREGVLGLFGRITGQVDPVDALSLTVRPKEILGIIGPNGAGKTTRNCRDTFEAALGRFNLGRDDISANINWFMYVPVERDGGMAIADGLSKAGDYVDLVAERDVICVASNCTQIFNPANGFRPTPVRIVTYQPM
jgi:hypothetical protein